MDDYNEDDLIMTEQLILEKMKKYNMYINPESYDILHLQKIGWLSIGGLENFTNLCVIWLSGNQITEITGLQSLKNLKTIYLQENFIEKIDGLSGLPNLEQLFLNSNYIRNLDGIEQCPSLIHLDVGQNHIKGLNCLDAVSNCHNLQILNLADNKIDDEKSIEPLSSLKDLMNLSLQGNPFVRVMKMYRRNLINTHQALNCLDEIPIEKEERRTVAAWARGGREEEAIERQKIASERNERERENAKAMRRLQRSGIIANGENLEDYPELMSSDDERREKLFKDKCDRLVEMADGTIKERDC